ncbi:MAG: shikimate dehydrogenase [Rhodospirillaceae bacterium]|nr:shikimate dehydrogenase [Rhodospirillaceae bacterium]
MSSAPHPISGKAKVAGVMGWPVGHSKSPALHGFWLRAHNIDGAYVPLPVKPENLATALRALPALGFAGVNLTVPHKEAALKIVDDISPTARAIGAINTIFVRPDGTLHGTNTDAFGFLENLNRSPGGFDANAGPVLVIGAGGAARAVCVALRDAGCPAVRVANRTSAKAQALASEWAPVVSAVAWNDLARAMADAALVVNATSLGMSGQPPLDLDLTPLPKTALVTDLVYSPLETPLLAAARARGHRVVDGLGMLLYQAQAGFEGWFGVKPEVTAELRVHVLAS